MTIQTRQSNQHKQTAMLLWYHWDLMTDFDYELEWH